MSAEPVARVALDARDHGSWSGIAVVVGLVFAPSVLISAEIPLLGLAIGPELVAIAAAWMLSLGRLDAASMPLFSPFGFPVALLVPIVAIGCATSGYLVGFLYFIQFLVFVSVFLLPPLWLRDAASIRTAVTMCVALLIVTYVIAELRPGITTDSYEHMYFRFEGEVVQRANILEFHPNAFAAMSTIFWLYVVFWFELAPRTWKLVVLAVALLMFAKTIVLTFSRSGFLAFTIVNLLVLAARPRLLLALLAATSIALAFTELLGWHVLELFLLERLLPTVRELGGENPRWLLLSAGIDAWLDSGPLRMLFGFGFFSILFDSTFPSVLVNMGIAGVATSAWLCVRLARLVVAHLPERRLAWLGLATMAGFAAYATFTEVWAVRKVLIPTFLLLGLLLAHGRAADSRRGV